MVDMGVDLTDYYPSIEWDILEVVRIELFARLHSISFPFP